jgi:DNA invertase Pin-like site-specific DNA recombinase
MPEGKVAEKPLRMIGLTRKSRGDDEGTHDDQRAIIDTRCKSERFDLIRVDAEHGVSGAKDWRTREVGKAVEDVKVGRADGIIVAYQDRITRERLLAGAEIWEAMQDAGAVFIACDGVDSRLPGSEMLFTIKAAIARDQWQTYQRRSNDGRRRAVEVEGVHGGDIAPLGYSFSERMDGILNASGKIKHGPLVPNDDSWRIPQAFECLDAGGSWAAVIRILGVKSQANASQILHNRVYLGEARSGEFVKEGAHPPLVDADLFDRVQRKLDKRAAARAQRPTECTPYNHWMTPTILPGSWRWAVIADSRAMARDITQSCTMNESSS